MEKNTYTIDNLIERYPSLAVCKEDILAAYNVLLDCFKNGNKLLVAGNGGSNADAEHIVGELMKGFKAKRALSSELKNKLIEVDKEMGMELSNALEGALPAICLSNHQSLNTAFINDVENGGVYGFAQQINGYGVINDVFLAITTSGNSKNILYAATIAKAKGLKVVALTGKDGGKIKSLADVSIIVPEMETFKIQELHLPIYHLLCLMLEENLF